MNKILLYIGFAIFVLASLTCANPVTLTGGEKDEEAPQVVENGIFPPNMKTNFSKTPIYFTFDEWVKLKDVGNQVVVSPPLKHKPDLKLKGKELTFLFDDEEILREKTTYTINFGEAIQDLTEGNPTDNLRYVFSTGDYIDSLSVSGKIRDAVEKTPVEGALVMLYENLADTVVRKQRPYYFSKTNKNGNYRIENIKKGTFKVFVLTEDVGQRYIFDNESEGIGFLESPIVLADSSLQNIEVKTFKELTSLQIKSKEEANYGYVQYKFNRNPFDLEFSYEDLGQDFFKIVELENMSIWHNSTKAFKIYTAYDTLWNDTLRIKKIGKDLFKRRNSLTKSKGNIEKIHAASKVEMIFNHPIDSIKMDSILLYEDSILVSTKIFLEKDSVDRRKLFFTTKWKTNKSYQVNFLPNALTDIYGIKNDTLTFEYLVQEKDKYGELNLVIDDLNSNYAYIAELLTLKNKLIDRFYIKGKDSFEKIYTHLSPNEYTLKIVEDKNANQRWDEGNYDLKIYPEKIFTQKLETLRANWTLESEIKAVFE